MEMLKGFTIEKDTTTDTMMVYIGSGDYEFSSVMEVIFFFLQQTY